MTTLLECSSDLNPNEKCICKSGQTDCVPVNENKLIDCHVSAAETSRCERQLDSFGDSKKYAMGVSGQVECCTHP